MNFLKWILIAAGSVVALLIAFAALGFIYNALFYIFLIGIAAVGGAVGYKLLADKAEKRQLGNQTPPVIAELKNTDRALEEYKRKYLSE